jgi:hypothetical protein
VETLVVLGLAACIAGVVGALVPLVPGGLLSSLGVVFYLASGVQSPAKIFLLTVLIVVGLSAFLFDTLGGIIAARLGGASDKVSMASAVGAVIGLLVLGPAGLFAGAFATVLAGSMREEKGLEQSLKAAAASAAALAASTIVQVASTVIVLFGLLALIVL